MGAPDL
jgi:hypothetical protein